MLFKPNAMATLLNTASTDQHAGNQTTWSNACATQFYETGRQARSMLLEGLNHVKYSFAVTPLEVATVPTNLA